MWGGGCGWCVRVGEGEGPVFVQAVGPIVLRPQAKQKTKTKHKMNLPAPRTSALNQNLQQPCLGVVWPENRRAIQCPACTDQRHVDVSSLVTEVSPVVPTVPEKGGMLTGGR